MRHSSEFRFGQNSRDEQNGDRRKPEFVSTKRCEHRYKLGEMHHKVDIVETFSYIARIPAGWLGLGGENVRTFGSETTPP